MNGISVTTSRVYLDSNAVIRFIESAETTIAPVFDRARIGLARIFTSELTLAEVLVAPFRNAEHELVAAYDEF
jgi:predicted nucleic acid-binding protein